MDLRKYLPLILIAFVLIFLLPQLLNSGKKSKTLSAKNRAALTLDALQRIDRGEQKYLAANGRYTSNLADLVSKDEQLAGDLTIGLTVEIDVGENGTSYLARASSDVLAVARARTGKKTTPIYCQELKSSVKCPESVQKPVTPTTTTATTTAPTTTG